MGRHSGASTSTSEHERIDETAEHRDHERGGARRARAAARDAEVRDRFGGTNLGAAFFGWLVAVGMTILLSGVVGAVATAVGSSVHISQTEAEREAGAIGLVAAVVLAAVLLLAYYTGGYVAGRMSRFDGGRQGLGVWFLGLLVTAVAVVLGVAFGTQYDVLDRVDLPRLPIPTDQVTSGGVITALAVLVVTALAAMAGGKVGRRYHAKVDAHLAA